MDPLESRIQAWVSSPATPAELEPVTARQSAGSRSWYQNYRRALIIGDACTVSLAILISHLLRFGFDKDFVEASWLVPVIIAASWLLFLGVMDSGNKRLLGAGLEEYRRVIVSSTFAFGAVAIGSYLFRAEVPRSYFALALPFGAAGLVMWRWLARQILVRRRLSGRCLTPAVVIGAPRHVSKVLAALTRRPETGVAAKAVALTDQSDPFLKPGVAVMGIDDVAAAVASGQIGAVLLADGVTSEEGRRISWALERTPVELMYVSEMLEVAGPRLTVRTVNGLDLIDVDLPRFSGWRLVVKRLFDIAFAGSALIILSPVYLAIALAIKLDDRGPVIFRQQRVGLHGQPFVIHKFRSMALDAEERLAALRARSTGNGVLFKMDEDPRVTRVGRILRKYSLDELPQFWTVLRGSMSVVGPRPHLARELDEFPDAALRRLLIKPGITGLWQVSGRSDLTFEESVALDLRYVENWSLVGDLVLVMKTVKTIAIPEGAY